MKTTISTKVLEHAKEIIQDYPLYGSVDGLTEKQIMLISNAVIQGGK